jgi:hypothetical protein
MGFYYVPLTFCYASTCYCKIFCTRAYGTLVGAEEYFHYTGVHYTEILL